MTTNQRRFYTSSDQTIDVSGTSPLSYFEWLQYENTFDKSNAFEQYTEYLSIWYKNKGVVSTTDQKNYVRQLYINLLKQITLDYTTPDEKRFLTNIDYENNNDLDIALPFFAKKLKQIAFYYSQQRDELKYTKVKTNLKGSQYGISQIIYKKVAEMLQNDETITTQLPDLGLTVDSILENLNIEIEELYDTEQNYYNIPPSADSQEYVSDNLNSLSRKNYFNTAQLPNSARMFISETYTEAIVDLIKTVPIALQSTTGNQIPTGDELETLVSNDGELYAITEIVTGTELGRLDDTFFREYNNTGELNINYEQLAFQKYSGTDYYYLSTGDSISTTVSGQLFSADSPHKDLLNRFYPTIASVAGENLYKIQYIGGFYSTTGIGISTYTSLDFVYRFKPKENTTYYFPDPKVGAAGYYGSYETYDTPVRYYENVNWNKQQVTAGYNYGSQAQISNLSRFYSYNSVENVQPYQAGIFRHDDKFDFWSNTGENIWENTDIYPLTGENGTQPLSARVDELLYGNKVLYKWKTDIYGNNYALVKTDVHKPPSPPVNTTTSITGTEYVDHQPSAKSSKINNLTSEPHDSKNFEEQKQAIGTLYIKNNTNDGLQSITHESIQSLYQKYQSPGSITYKDIQITIQDIGDEIINSLIDIDIINDIIIFETTNYIIFEKIDYDYDTAILSSGQKRYAFIYKHYYGNVYEQSGNWWHDEGKNRILYVRTNVNPSLSGTTSRMIYPIIYNYSMTKMELNQIYPDPDLSEDQLLYETGQFSLSAVDGTYNITKVKQPILTYNVNSERYSVSQLWLDNSRNVFFMKTDFRLYEETIELIVNNFYKHNYIIYSLNSKDPKIMDYFTEINPQLR